MYRIYASQFSGTTLLRWVKGDQQKSFPRTFLMRNIPPWQDGLSVPLWTPDGDGAYADASFCECTAYLGCVRLQNGELIDHVSTSIPVQTRNVDALESMAVRMAQERWPGVPVFTDNKNAARDCCASWVPREHNRLAHRAAKRARNPELPPIPDKKEPAMKVHKKSRFRGRGCVQSPITSYSPLADGEWFAKLATPATEENWYKG